MTIREITEYSDKVYNSVLNLLAQLDPGIKLPPQEFLKKILESENSHFFVAELDNNEIIGMLTLSSYDVPTGTKFWIEDVVVDKSCRGKGYGKELLLHALRFAGSAGARAVDLTSRPYRIAANQLYIDSGFVKRDTNVYRYHFG